MIKNDLLLRVISGEKVDRPPIWLMRQAGRILPEYRALRTEVGSFLTLVRTPELASTVTIQPIDHLGVDAAIIFSDILVIPEAMGLSYRMEKGIGPVMDKVIESESDVDKLIHGIDAAEQLSYVYDAVELTVKKLDERVPLIGFAGAPWTLLCYMIEGRGSKNFSKSRAFLRRYPILSHTLLDKITDTIISYLNLKVDAGVDVVQIFDSWAGLLNQELYRTFCIPYLRRICLEVQGQKIVFAKGAHFAYNELKELSCTVLGVDWTMNLEDVRKLVGQHKVIQGNLDPSLLYADDQTIKNGLYDCIKAVGKNHILNLGHGVYPDTPLESVKILIHETQQFKYVSLEKE